MISFLKQYSFYFIGGALGAISGFLYWHQIGCESGNCLITSNPVVSTIYGAFFGAVLFSNFKKDKKQSDAK